MDVDRSKTRVRKTKKGRSGGLLADRLQKAGSAAAGAPKTSE